MSMQELPDDQLDGLFRKSLEESEVPYDPAAWPTMEHKLTVYDRQQFWQRWLRRVLPVIVALVLPVSLWLLTRDHSATDSADQSRSARLVASKSVGRSVARPSEKPPVNESSGSAAVETAVPESVVHMPDRLVDQRATAAGVSAKISRLQSPVLAMRPLNIADQKDTDSTESAISSERTEAAARTTPAPANGTTTRIARTKRTRTVEPSGADLVAAGPVSRKISGRGAEWAASGDLGGSASLQRTVATTEESRAARLQVRIEPLRNRFPAIVNQLPAINRSVVAPVSDEQAAQLPAVSRDRTSGLSMRAVVSPDLSSVGMTNFSRPGTNVGLMLEYQFRRWRVQAGLLRSVKVYQAAESAYEYSAVRQWPVVPSSIDGRCNMLDIPINLRYDVALVPRQRALPPSRWFVSAGATTYYMLREDYTYKYDNPADPKIKYRDWTTETGRYGFSQLNLSAGYERAVTQRLFWQVEPFLKVPLKGVGYYKINLISTGAFFSLRYRL